MKVSIISKNIKAHQIIPCFEYSLTPDFIYQHTGFKKIEDFKAENGEIYSLIHPITTTKITLVGLGNKQKNENTSNIARKAVHGCLKLSGPLVINVDHLEDHVKEHFCYGALLAFYNIFKYKIGEENKLNDIRLLSSSKTFKGLVDKVKIMVESTFNCMDLVNLPSNIKTPYYIADYAMQSGKKYGFTTKIIRGEQLVKNNLHAVYAVGKASNNPPAFIIMEYKPKQKTKNSKTIGLIGKGVSFDTGGISIKPSANMHYMKCDMAGAATVITTMELAAKMNWPHHIIGIVPTAENAVSGNAYKPGDVIKSYSGKHIEVIDTDAEGRLILADALAYMVKNYKTDTLIDLATLTGSCVATLGYFAAGLFTHNDDLADALYHSGQASGDKVWRLPLWDEYKSYMNSDIADIKNLSSVPVAGATTAAKFLEFFTEKHQSWAHIDIAGVSFNDSDIYKSRTATGFGLRLLADFIEKQ